uniref:Elongation factor Tu-type domain-containing protein n=1 Tax=Lutzomyia longipalpis TaxID=7200 RepID=A0A1B0CG43_LUTLO
MTCGQEMALQNEEFVELGIVTSIESNHKQIESARKGQEVCIKIEPLPGETPKMFGRHFEETDMLVSKLMIVVGGRCDVKEKRKEKIKHKHTLKLGY